MSLWFNHCSPRHKDKGKFLHQARTGMTSSGNDTHRGWTYHFTNHQTGTSVKRTTYGVSIADPHSSRVEYLRGFSNLDQAASAACKWIDLMFEKMGEPLPNAALGNIPKFPNAAVNQVK